MAESVDTQLARVTDIVLEVGRHQSAVGALLDEAHRLLVAAGGGGAVPGDLNDQLIHLTSEVQKLERLFGHGEPIG